MKRRYIEIYGASEEYRDDDPARRKCTDGKNIAGYTKNIFIVPLRVPLKIFKGLHNKKVDNINETNHKCTYKNGYLDYDCVYGQMNN